MNSGCTKNSIEWEVGGGGLEVITGSEDKVNLKKGEVRGGKGKTQYF